MTVAVELDQMLDRRPHISVDISLDPRFFGDRKEIVDVLFHDPIGSERFHEKANEYGLAVANAPCLVAFMGGTLGVFEKIGRHASIHMVIPFSMGALSTDSSARTPPL